MSYEYIHPYRDRLREKPLKADTVLNRLNEEGFNPVAVRVDNNTGSVWVYFEGELPNKEKSRLDEVVEDFLREW